MSFGSHDLTGSGYTRYHNHHDNADDAPGLWQKRVTDDSGTRYFIDILEYDWNRFHQWKGKRFTYSAEVHFYRQPQMAHCVIRLTDDDVMTSIGSIEILFDRIWTQLGMGHYQLADHD
jgi:hypothetical protein